MATDPFRSLFHGCGFPALADLGLDLDLLPSPRFSSPSTCSFSELDHNDRFFSFSSTSDSARTDSICSGLMISSRPAESSFSADPRAPAGLCGHQIPPPAREELESVLDVLKSPSREDVVWLDSLTPVSSTTTEDYTSTEELVDFYTPTSTPSSTPADETKVHLWPFSGFQSAAADIQDGVAQYSSSDITQKESHAKRHSRISNRKHQLPPLSPKALSPRSDASTRSDKRKSKEYGTSVPFNFKASTKDEAMYDGFRWQKYCKKSIKESPYPRFYFKCQSKHCTARKQVQHCPADPKVVLTTYEGTHNHDPPPSLPVGMIVSGGPCMCQSSRVLPCLNCLSKV